MKKTIILLAGVSVMSLSACTTTGNMERNAAIGAGLGGITGAIIGNNVGDGDVGTGAAIGAIIGGAGGANSGYRQDQRTGQWHSQGVQPTLHWDRYHRRYYYVDAHTGCTYWQNGQRRS